MYRKEYRRRGDSIYAAGLLHDLGIIVEDQFIHETFLQVLDRRAEEKAALTRVETEVFGYSHADVARVVAEDWGLPAETQVALGFHHTPDAAPAGFSRNVCTVYLANELCARRGLGYVDDASRDDALYAYCLRTAKLDEQALELITRDVEEDLASMEKEGLI
jgi:HD-like signal output (HDOD) protein